MAPPTAKTSQMRYSVELFADRRHSERVGEAYGFQTALDAVCWGAGVMGAKQNPAPQAGTAVVMLSTWWNRSDSPVLLSFKVKRYRGRRPVESWELKGKLKASR